MKHSIVFARPAHLPPLPPNPGPAQYGFLQSGHLIGCADVNQKKHSVPKKNTRWPLASSIKPIMEQGLRRLSRFKVPSPFKTE